MKWKRGLLYAALSLSLLNEGCAYIKKIHKEEDRQWNSMTPEVRKYWENKHREWELERSLDRYKWIEEERMRR